MSAGRFCIPERNLFEFISHASETTRSFDVTEQATLSYESSAKVSSRPYNTVLLVVLVKSLSTHRIYDGFVCKFAMAFLKLEVVYQPQVSRNAIANLLA